jgi:hypothetical protein
LITTLDTLSWSPELVTGNAEFIELSQPGFGSGFYGFGPFGGGTGASIFVISNVRNNSAGFGFDFGVTFGSQFSFEVLQSGATPPAPGPGSTFQTVASYVFPQPNYTFDPVAVYAPAIFVAPPGFGTGTFGSGPFGEVIPNANPAIHIVGTRNTPTGAITSSNQYSDVIKFTYDTVAQTLTGPIVLSSGTRIRGAYDIAVLPNGNQVVAMALAEPAIQGSNQVTFVSVQNNIATLTFAGDITPFVPGQWVLLDNFANAGFLNGQLVQVISANSGSFSFVFQLPTTGFGINFGNMFGSYSQPETATPFAYATPVGDCILVVELDANSAVPQGFGYIFGESFGSNEVVLAATIIESSPARSGNSFDALSLVTDGNNIELYYQTHPKVVTFQDQVFTIKLATAVPADFGYDFGFSFGSGPLAWNLPATVLTTYTARYSDNRLTVIADAAGNRYLSQTYWNQFNHPYGILGNALIGYKPSAGPWFFHSAIGSFMGGSIIQSTLAIAQDGTVNLVYLLQPFDQITNPPSATVAAWPLQVATVTTNPPTLDLTQVPGFYNDVNFTWLRGTKSAIDDGSVWAIVGEREILTTVSGEQQTIPALPAQTAVQVTNHVGYFENIAVNYAISGIPLIQVATAPDEGQYTVEPSTGEYSFNRNDAGARIIISYNYVSSIQPVYVSLFNVPPVAVLSPEVVTVYRGGTFYSTDTANITQINLTGGSVTVIVNNDFKVGDQVAMYGISGAVGPFGQGPFGAGLFSPAFNATASFLNGILLTVASATATQFTAFFSPQLAATVELLSELGFGFNFGNSFSEFSELVSGTVADLIPGALTLSAAGSTDADNDALEFFWSENDPDLKDVTLTPNGSQATLNVARKVGPASRNFNVGVSVVDLNPDLITQRHPALLISNATVTGADSITLTFAPPGGAGFGAAFGAQFGLPVPAGAVVPIAGDQVMMYDMMLTAPQPPTLGQIPGGSLPPQPNLSVIITYVNNAGETVGSSNAILSVSANNLLTVNSPGGNGSATAYNVYVGQPGNETLQTLTPQPLGSTFVESTGGFISSFTTPPVTSTALEVVLNDEVLTLTNATSSTMTAPFTTAGTFGLDFGFSFNGNYTASLTGFAIKEFQWEIANIFVPQNVAPTIVFPAPLWRANALGVSAVTATSASSNVLTVMCANAFVVGEMVTLSGTAEIVLNGQLLTVTSANSTQFTANFTIADYTNNVDTGTATLRLARNTQITITPTPKASDPTTQFPVVYTGIYDPDDSVSYLWTQTAGTPVTLVGGNNNSSLSFLTNGVNINGETLTFSLTVNDSVNSPVTASFTVNVASFNFAGTKDTEQLSRSTWSQTANITNVAITSGVVTVTANNSFLVGEPVRLTGLVNAIFLNDTVGFYVTSANATQFTFTTTFPNYPSTSDTGIAYAKVPISQRNSPQIWSPMDISVLFSDLISIKRVSVIDGSDRYILISPYSVLVYGVFPSATPVAILLRKLLTPNRTTILDAVHTEQDYTLVLDNQGNIFRYTTAPLIDTDNPDTTLTLSSITSVSFTDADLDSDVKIMTTPSFGNKRIVVLSGEQGAVLMQLNTTTLVVEGVLDFLTSDHLIYGSNAIQFVRWVNMDNLHTGRVLLGSVVYNTANVTNVSILNNALTFTGSNSFVVGDKLVLSGFQNAAFLNGLTVIVISATSTSFTASFQFSGSYGPSGEASAVAEAQFSGTTYETLVDLSQGQIVGTWDKSKLRNQFVQSGEILFTPDTTYGGSPIPPVLLQPTSAVQNGKTFVTISWQQERPDLITSYIVSYATETLVNNVVPLVAPYTVQIPIAFTFTADEGATDTASPITITQATVTGNVLTITGNNNFAIGQGVSFSSLTGLPSLIGTTLPISTLIGVGPTYTGFTAPFTHADYGHLANVANVTIVSNVLEIQTAVNHTFLPGTQVSFNTVVGTASFLNGQTVTIVSVPTANTFHASFNHVDYPTTVNTGNIVDADTGSGFVFVNTPLVAVTGTPQAGQYTVTPTGLYTFNAAQAGHSVSLSIRQSFNALQNVGSGATQSITVQMATGQTYFFEVQAFGLDGASGESNTVSISI